MWGKERGAGGREENDGCRGSSSLGVPDCRALICSELTTAFLQIKAR